MKEEIINFKAIIVSVAGFVSARLGITGKLISVLFLVVLIDYVSGTIASGYEGKLSSKKGYKGILKKLSYFVAVCSAMVVDYLIQFFFSVMGLDFRLKATLAALLSVWLILNEVLSVLENLKRMEIKLPGFLEKIIMLLIGNVEKNADVAKTKENLEKGE